MTWMNKVSSSMGVNSCANVPSRYGVARQRERRTEERAGGSSVRETFEIIMDRLEKDWFDLVRLQSYTFPVPHLNFVDRQRTYPSRIWQCHLRIRHAPFATTRRVRIRMRSCFAMGATLLYIKIAMECRIFLKVNGYAESAPSHLKHQW
jgi:hypothetical protein